MSRTWTSFTAWVKDMRQAWSKHIIPVVVVAVAFGMFQKPLLALLTFIESTCLAHLSPNWVGAFVALLACYLLKRERDYRKIYVPRSVSLWLILLLGIYLYYRHLEGSFSFWPIPYLGELAWSDLLLIPWFGAVAIALGPREEEYRLALFEVLLVLCSAFYFAPQTQGKPSLVWALLSLCVAEGSCLLASFILYRWGNRLLTTSKEEAQREMELRPQAIDPDDAIVSKEDDFLFSYDMAYGVHAYLTTLDLSKRSLTVGFIAPWGRGKSSFINLLRIQLEEDGGIIIPFNPRGSKSISSIPEDFFDTFAKELSRHYLGFGLLLARYTKHIGLLNQYEWTRPLGSLLTLVLPGKEQEAVNRTLRELGKRVYVLLDDLDRLSGEEILEVLKLMDRNASFSNTVFIVAYDKAYVNNVLKKHLDHGLDHSFIDKYISWETPLPAPNKEVLELLMKREFRMRVKDVNPMIYEEIKRGCKEVGSTVVESLNSVRDLKRYLNLMIPRYYGVSSKVDCGDYFLLYLLCYKDLGVYLALHSRRILQLDVSNQTYMLIPSYEEELKQVSQWKGSKSILERLFALSPEEKKTDLLCRSLLIPSYEEGLKQVSQWKGSKSILERSFALSPEEEKTDLLCRSLRSAPMFDTYFRGFKSPDSIFHGLVLSEITHSMSKRRLLKDIDDLLEDYEVGRVAEVFLQLVSSPCQRGENRAETIKAMAYMAFTLNLPEGLVKSLKEELEKFFLRDQYEKYKELQVAPDLPSYKLLLEPMLSFVVEVNPQWISSIIHDLSQAGSVSPGGCIYSIEELSKLLSDHQRS